MKKGIEETKFWMGELNNRMRLMSSDIEVIKEYLRDLREATLGRDGSNKEKALMHLEPSPSYSPPRKELPPLLPE